MYICIALSQGADLPQTTQYVHPAVTFLSLSMSSAINSEGNTWLCWTLFIRAVHCFFPLPAKNSGILMNGRSCGGKLYLLDWCPYIKETFKGFGNAIEYLGRYTHKIAISNSRILSISETETVFSARGKKPGCPKRQITVRNQEFIRRFLLHVLPDGFQKIRYYGFLNNRMKGHSLKLIFTLQGHQKFKMRYQDLSIAELLKAVWKVYITLCPVCGGHHMEPSGRTYAIR